MLNGAQLGYLGGILGTALGFAGGAIGTYCSIRNTSGPREQRFMIRACVVGWVAMLVFLALLLGLPSPYRFFMWIPYGIALPLGIQYVNKKLHQFKLQDSQDKNG